MKLVNLKLSYKSSLSGFRVSPDSLVRETPECYSYFDNILKRLRVRVVGIHRGGGIYENSDLGTGATAVAAM